MRNNRILALIILTLFMLSIILAGCTGSGKANSGSNVQTAERREHPEMLR